MRAVSEIIDNLPKNQIIKGLEDLIKEKEITPEIAHVILIQHPLSEQEVRGIGQHIRDFFFDCHALGFPWYELNYRVEKGIGGMFAATTDMYNRTIDLPSSSGLQLPLTLAHELVHSYQMEHGVVYSPLRAMREEKVKGNNIRVFSPVQCLVEGWATFVSKIYARARDKGIGRNIYEKALEEKNSWSGFLGALGNAEAKGQYDGCELFEMIYERHGFDFARKCAVDLIADSVLGDVACGFSKK